MAFVHLHTHTEYSLLDGSNKIKEYVKRVKELEMNAAAITDHGVMYGVIDFYKACKAAEINPVIGCEVYVAPGSRFDKEQSAGEERYFHLVLLAENNIGYENLIKIVSAGFTEGYYYKPRVDLEVLEKYHDGIIALSACLAGEIPRAILRGRQDEADIAALRLQEIFGKDNFFLELQDHGITDQATVNMAIMDMSQRLGIELVATNDVHYTYAEDAEPHDILLCLQTGKKLSDEDRMRYVGGQYYVKSEMEMRTLFPYAQNAVTNTQLIADRCHVEIEFGNYKVPHFEVPDGYDSRSFLQELCDEGMKERYPDDDGTLRKRLDYELGVIEHMGFVDYFLIVWDYINYCRENGIAVGPGRGSAAGSIVSYCLHITNIDPIKYDLLFERFLNPERVSMPDIDVDFCYERRGEVIDYVSEKYGADHVVQIVTFGTMAARGVIRDVGRVMDIPYAQASELAKMVPNELGITLDKALEMNPELRAKYENEPETHHLLDMCRRLEGLPRHTSMHAAGVVICPDSADTFVPLSRGSDGSITTQFTMTTIEELGLLKMDFLGLRTLTVIQNACKMIESGHGVSLDMDHIDYNDPAVLALIGSGHTEGIFQLESGGMKGFMKELKPQSLEDVIAGISLYRPGPMDFIPKYIQGKNNQDSITFETPELEPILSPTYGCIVYQEQVMQIVRSLAGYSMGQADNIRKAMSKKKQYLIDENREYFVHGSEDRGIAGCVEKGVNEAAANKIYDSMVDFAKYAFNKSHAACYAVVAYQTAFLKNYYPVEFMAALLTSVMDNSAKVSEYIMTCKSMGIKIMPPDINEGEVGFSVKDGYIRYALTAIKAIGRPVIDAIVIERSIRGPYKDIEDFITRTCEGDHAVNKRAIENLIKAGAFDLLGGTRKQYMAVYLTICDRVHKDRKNNLAGQMTLFDIMGEDEKDAVAMKLPPIGEYPKDVMLALEKEVLGMYLSGHPIEEYQGLWKKHITNTTSDFMLDEETGETIVKSGARATIGGIIAERKIKYTRNDTIMAFLTLEDMVGSVEVIVFPKNYEKLQGKILEDEKVFIKGRVSDDDDQDAKLICEDVIRFEDMPKKLWVQFCSMKEYEEKEQQLFETLKVSDGKDSVAIFIKDTRQIKELPRNMSVDAGEELIGKLAEVFGEENIKIT